MGRLAILVATMAALTAGLVATASSAGAVITGCGQEVPSNTIAALQGDLVCQAAGPPAVILNDKSRLDLNGHTITGGQYGVYINGRKAVIKDGSITGAGNVAVFRPDNTGHDTVILENVDISNSSFGIVLGQQNKIRLYLLSVSVHDNANAAIADCTGLTIVATSLDVRHNADGICGSSITLKNSTVQDNTGIGVFNWFGPVRLSASHVDGNGGNNIIPGPVDIASHQKPHLANGSSCGHSLKMPKFPSQPVGTPTWGTCSGD